ncbi:uncharacterized protein TNIN_384371 [Trichonephila inaurata madagascariensis]|uniref:Uncharacterized protein n=1 Tax=Trichonephila inaurata madagascariensis TaxID=2747483 RepID=A0A8X6XXL1_9ARAC|nr:uncharacterized protein TNIN_384371 [Trichonephila inaurata madagascariensis]
MFRGGQLAPMQWSSGPQANFTSEESTPWLPLHPNYITRNVASTADQLKLFRKLTEMKRNEDIFSAEYSNSRTSLMHTLAVRFSVPFEDEPLEYEWYYNKCGLLAARTILGDVLLIANFGTDTLGFKDNLKCQDGESNVHFFTADYIQKQIDIVLSTNNLHGDRERIQDLVLEAGDAIIGRFFI